jgi:hypothetical protein
MLEEKPLKGSLWQNLPPKITNMKKFIHQTLKLTQVHNLQTAMTLPIRQRDLFLKRKTKQWGEKSPGVKEGRFPLNQHKMIASFRNTLSITYD